MLDQSGTMRTLIGIAIKTNTNPNITPRVLTSAPKNNLVNFAYWFEIYIYAMFTKLFFGATVQTCGVVLCNIYCFFFSIQRFILAEKTSTSCRCLVSVIKKIEEQQVQQVKQRTFLSQNNVLDIKTYIEVVYIRLTTPELKLTIQKYTMVFF